MNFYYGHEEAQRLIEIKYYINEYRWLIGRTLDAGIVSESIQAAHCYVASSVNNGVAFDVALLAALYLNYEAALDDEGAMKDVIWFKYARKVSAALKILILRYSAFYLSDAEQQELEESHSRLPHNVDAYVDIISYRMCFVPLDIKGVARDTVLDGAYTEYAADSYY